MKTILTAALLASSMFAAPTILMVSPAAATTCPENAPEGFKRPGGFCDLRTKTDTLAPPVASAPAAEAAPPVAPSGGCGALDMRKLLMHLPRGARILSAC